MVKESAVVGTVLVLSLVGLALFALIRPVNLANLTLMPTSSSLTLASPAFEHNGKIPAAYTCDGDRTVSPPLTINGVPEDAKSLALVMDDPDIPAVKKKEFGMDSFDHWVLFNIPPQTREIPEGGPPAGAGTPGRTTQGELRYMGPCPPPEYEPKEHRYIFKLYALSDLLTLAEGATKREVLDALTPLVIEEAELIGRYSRG